MTFISLSVLLGDTLEKCILRIFNQNARDMVMSRQSQLEQALFKGGLIIKAWSSLSVSTVFLMDTNWNREQRKGCQQC